MVYYSSSTLKENGEYKNNATANKVVDQDVISKETS